MPGPWGDRLRRVLGIDRAGACKWHSSTAFVPPRFLKRSGRNTLEGQVTAELEIRGFSAPRSIRCVDPHESDDLVYRRRHFIRRRGGRTHQPPPVDCGYVVELEFAEPVCGPIAIGYASHFGLGLFEASENE